jgi:hypothetical protein
MKPLYQLLTAAQRGAALVAVDTYRGRDFMGWRSDAEAALRSPGQIVRDGAVIRALVCDLGGLADLAENHDGHRLSDRPQLAVECRGAQQAIRDHYGWPVPL